MKAGFRQSGESLDFLVLFYQEKRTIKNAATSSSSTISPGQKWKMI
jgi:hypothetical protein